MIKQNINAVKKKISLAQQEVGIETPVTLVVVTKNRPVEALNEVINCGISNIGENRVQDIVEKSPYLS